MKFLKKTLAVMLSLALGSSMVLTPAFAASFKELQGAINSNETGYFGEKEDIYAATDENGKRNVTLNGDVEREEGDTNISVVGKDKDVTLNLNGYTINGNDSSRNIINVGFDAKVTIDGKGEGEKKGSITGGNSGIYVTGGNVTVKDVEITGNHSTASGGGIMVGNGGKVELDGVDIHGNEADYNGGGIAASMGSNVTIKNSNISDNKASTGTGGGIYANMGSEVEIENSEITKNEASSGGGGISAYLNTDITVKESNIEGNKAWDGGGIYVGADSSLDVEKSEIKGNKAHGSGGGIYEGFVYNEENEALIPDIAIKDSKVEGNEAEMEGGGIYSYFGNVSVTGNSGLANNIAGAAGDDVYAWGGKLKLPVAGGMGETLEEDGKKITGWYYDGGGRWRKDVTFPYFELENEYADSAVMVKAAHNQYVGVSYYLDAEDETPYAAAEAEKGQTLLELDVESPEREGFTFDGWEAVEGVDEEGKVTGEVRYVAKWTENERPVTPTPTPTQPPTPDEPGVDVEDPDVPLGEEPDDEVEIEDEDVPLAGPVTRAQFIDYLWRHEGEPEGEPCTFTDVPEDHEYVEALGWAQANGIAVAFEDGSFAPDDLVTVGAARDFLNRFAGVVKMTMPALTALVGEDDDPVLNSDEVLAEFFGEE